MAKFFNGHPSWLTYRELLYSEFDIEVCKTIKETRQNILGHEVRMDVWEPDKASLGTILLVHGAGGHGRLLAPFAERLCRLGWQVIAPDLPGYGLTSPSEGWNYDYADWIGVLAQIADQQQGRAIFMGASMGGLTAVYSAMKSQFVSSVLATTLIDLSRPRTFAGASRWSWMGWLSVLGFRSIPWVLKRFKLPLKIVAPLRLMNANLRVQGYFLNDELLGQRWLPLRFWLSVFKYRARNISLAGRLWLIHPGEDKWTSPKVSLDTFRRINAAKESRFLTNGSHLPLEQPAFDELFQHVSEFLAAEMGDVAPLRASTE